MKKNILYKYIHVIICEEKFINRTDHPAKGQRPNTKILETLPEKRKSNENFAWKLSFFDWYFFYLTFLSIQGEQFDNITFYIEIALNNTRIILRNFFSVLLLIYKYKIWRHMKDYFTLECNVSSFIKLTHPVVIKNSIHGKWKENMYYNAGILQIFHRALHFIKSVTCSTGWRNNMFNLCTSVSSDIQVLLENTYVKTL